MNKKILEFAKEAGCSIDGMGYGEGNVEEFAELIIRECAKQVRNTDLEDVEGGDSSVLYAASEQLKNYFGVN